MNPEEKQSGKITIRLSEDKIEAIEQIVKEGEYESISEVVRHALDYFLDARPKPGETTRKVVVEIPSRDHDLLEEYKSEGLIVSEQDAIRAAVAKWLEEFPNKELENLTKVRALRAELLKEKTTRMKIKENLVR